VVAGTCGARTATSARPGGWDSMGVALPPSATSALACGAEGHRSEEGSAVIDEPRSSDDPAGIDSLLAANQAFYDAFEAADIDAMSDVWEHADRVVCTHPGWATQQGWGRVAASWYAIFQNPNRLQFILTEVAAVAEGQVGWVSLNENLLDASSASTVAALNVFVRSGDGWKLVAHHGSPVMGR